MDVTGRANDMADTNDLIRREDAMMAVAERINQIGYNHNPLVLSIRQAIVDVPSAQPEIIRCKDCKHWRRAIAYGQPLSWGFCESDEMWQSLYGETCEVEHIDTEEDHYCSYGERKDDG